MGKGPEMRGWPIVGTTVVAAAIDFSVCGSEWQMGGNWVVRLIKGFALDLGDRGNH